MAAQETDDWECIKEVDSFICPITCCVMDDPVSTLDGHTYERAAISSWLEVNDTSPITSLQLKDKGLIPNHSLKKAIAEFAADPLKAKWLREMSIREGKSEPAFPTARIELLIVGPSGVGKSSLLRRLRDGGFLAELDTTVGFDYEQKSFATGAKNCHAKVWDTSGQAVFRDTVRTQYRSANVVYFVFDVSRPETLEQLSPYVKDAQATAPAQGGRKRELILVGNKVDLRSGSEEEPLLMGSTQVSAEEASAFVEAHHLDDYREVSAKTGANVKLTFNRSLAHAAALAGPSTFLGGNKGGGKQGCACGN